MTQLLTSVKNVDEAMLALYAGVNLIDLKDPGIGALGPLNINEAAAIVDRLADLRGPALVISATVGETHQTVSALINDIQRYHAIGVDVVKIAVSELCLLDSFFVEVQKLTNQGVKLVVVFFAEKAVDTSLLKQMAAHGFYGAMMDTQVKTHALIDVKTIDALNKFVMTCNANKLISGLAGTIHIEQLNMLLQHKPDFIGMRSGLCESGHRTAKLCKQRVLRAKQMLLGCNNGEKAGKNRPTANCN